MALTTALISVGLMGSAADAQSATSTRTQPAKLLAEPLPGHPKPEGEPAFYKPDSLYQYIDGGADVYLLYDFQSLMHQEFKSGVAELIVDIYDMGKSEDAFGIYSAERAWGIITGATSMTSPFNADFTDVPNWVAGAPPSRPWVACDWSFTGGPVIFTQYADTIDHDFPC